ncbi:MAG: DUF2555 domain-containing protein [Synechococcus sp. SB0668_bin_15]|nr:DUF2555 domain-containing protein [Synechococcus sp. SB0668_bin_15]MXZ82531.1 DUF2555 domain-containing protein [Synechococcus sp. SB0666_bin_14]MYA91089.1 DUF2555 domain-containing protein [Synechococcus sp. SB0663_bin_10]MYC50582.1 DUF2555 domain-containing protein [Synechococcus sp. SB0662_bin_14]MYG47624.1 DUF2555 domain-containing protein [Synechococcus sp. SB0675_bin_6]MYJ59344.1 DUF2555 domain-containing protein [Synechococcus sp. SB0672_bin_6]MYK91491.1 DUF2555 domain-containing pr
MGSDLTSSSRQLEQQLAAMNGTTVAAMARRLEEDDYADAFAGLQDWHLLRALAIHRPDLVQPYRHLIDQEPFDED